MSKIHFLKQLLIISVLFISAFAIHSQENIIVDESKMWSNMQENCLPEGNQYTTFFHRFEGDTVIDGNTYKMVWIAEDEYYQEWFFYGAFVREENGKVYYREYFGEEGLIYDFNITLGDTITISNPLAPEGILLTFEEIDEVETEDGYRERWKLVKDEFSIPEYWIEGIGSESGVLNSGTGVFGGYCGSYTLLCLHENDEPVFLNPDFETCYYMLLDDGNNISDQEQFSMKYNRNLKKINFEFAGNNLKQIMLTNISGVPVFRSESRETNISIDVHNLHQGLYIATILQNGRVSTRKLMIL